MKIEYYLYRKMSDGFEDLVWNGNSLFQYLKYLLKDRKKTDRVSTILIRGLWKPKHLTAINYKSQSQRKPKIYE